MIMMLDSHEDTKALRINMNFSPLPDKEEGIAEKQKINIKVSLIEKGIKGIIL